MEQVDKTTVQLLLRRGLTYRQISAELNQLYPGVSRGLSSHSVRRFASQHNLQQLTRRSVEEEVEKAVGEVGCLQAFDTRRMLSCMLICNYSAPCKPALLSENIGALASQMLHLVLLSHGVWPLKSLW